MFVTTFRGARKLLSYSLTTMAAPGGLYSKYAFNRSLSSTLQPDSKEAYTIGDLSAQSVTEAKVLSVLGKFRGKRLISFEPPVEEEPSALLAELNAAKEAFAKAFDGVEFNIDMNLTSPDGLYVRPENTALTAADFIRGCASETAINISEVYCKRMLKTWLHIEIADSSTEVLQRVWRLEMASIILARIHKKLSPKAVIVLVTDCNTETFHEAVKQLDSLPSDRFVKKIPFYVGILDSDQSTTKTFLENFHQSQMKNFEVLSYNIARSNRGYFWMTLFILIILKMVFKI